jgi:hypothetical protein
MTIEELLERVPEPWRPVVAQYGAALLAMSAEELWAWIDLLIRGRTAEAYETLVARLEGAELLVEWDRLNAAWSQANRENAGRLELQRAAAVAVLKVLLAAALALVGL